MADIQLMTELSESKLEALGFMECPDGTGDPRGTSYEYENGGFCLMVDAYKDVALYHQSGVFVQLKIEDISDLEDAKGFIDLITN